MFLARIIDLTAAKRQSGVSAAALALSLAIVATPVAGLAVHGTAAASDLDYSQPGTQSDDGSYLRIGLNKTAVIKLPAAAKDVIVGDPAVVTVELDTLHRFEDDWEADASLLLRNGDHAAIGGANGVGKSARVAVIAALRGSAAGRQRVGTRVQIAGVGGD